MIKEIWKDKKDYEGHYQVSNCGRVKSLRRLVTNQYNSFYIEEKILKPKKDRYGYLYVNLYKNNIKKVYQVHRLVAEAFIDNPDNLPQVNHRDENKLNNNVDNLEWCTHEYNINYGTRNKKVSKKLSKPVLQYTLDGEFVREWKSTMECGRNGYNQGHIVNCCQGKHKTHKGYIWKYK